MNKLVIGVGTGRCGTKSLTKLLGIQDDTYATHERYGSRVRWNCPPNLWPLRLWEDTLNNSNTIVADIDFKWTSHIDTFLKWASGSGRRLRIVGLKRDRQKTIDSYSRWKPDSDHWSFHGYRETKEDQWDHCYPCFPTDNKKEAIGLFWDKVYGIIESFDDKRVRCFRTQDLNTQSGVESILRFVGMETVKAKAGIKVNAPTLQGVDGDDVWYEKKEKQPW